MKKFIKFIFSIITLAIITCGIVLGIMVYQGYELYKDTLSKTSIEKKVDEIRSKSDYITIDNINKDFQNAIIAIEDHRFESHGAVDFISIGRAIFRNIVNWNFSEGGSTITQQLAKNTFFTQERNITRKVAEIFAAFDLEEKYSKDEILEMYVNTIYFGDGYYGINAASHGYFNKKPIELSFDEATLLAGIPNAPSIYSLSNNPDLVKQRQKYVINSMIEYGFITEEEINNLQ